MPQSAAQSLLRYKKCAYIRKIADARAFFSDKFIDYRDRAGLLTCCSRFQAETGLTLCMGSLNFQSMLERLPGIFTVGLCGLSLSYFKQHHTADNR